MAVSVRQRFEIFKRDEFTCHYCGRRSPDVVLEVDHIVAVANGGSDDPINLITSCWDCNRGKSAVPLAERITGEDPHDRAVAILERERQLEEYNAVIERENTRREDDAWELIRYWLDEQGLLTDEQRDGGMVQANRQDFSWLKSALAWCPKEKIREFMDIAIGRRMTKSLRYVAGCARAWRYERTAARDMSGRGNDFDGFN